MTRTAADLDLIWRATHSDFRVTYGNDRCILICRQGITTLVALTDMTDDEFADKIAYAKRWAARQFIGAAA